MSNKNAICHHCGNVIVTTEYGEDTLRVHYCKTCTSTEHVAYITDKLAEQNAYIRQLERKLCEYNHTWSIPELAMRHKIVQIGLDPWIGANYDES